MEMTNQQYMAKELGKIIDSLGLPNTLKTVRQASKFRNKKGQVYKAFKAKSGVK